MLRSSHFTFPKDTALSWMGSRPSGPSNSFPSHVGFSSFYPPAV